MNSLQEDLHDLPCVCCGTMFNQREMLEFQKILTPIGCTRVFRLFYSEIVTGNGLYESQPIYDFTRECLPFCVQCRRKLVDGLKLCEKIRIIREELEAKMTEIKEDVTKSSSNQELWDHWKEEKHGLLRERTVKTGRSQSTVPIFTQPKPNQTPAKVTYDRKQVLIGRQLSPLRLSPGPVPIPTPTYSQRGRLTTKIPIAAETFDCDTCGKKLLTKVQLRYHKRNHPNKIIECVYCKRRYSRIDRLNAHIKSHHQDVSSQRKQRSCHLCNKTFVSASVLQSHMQLQHALGQVQMDNTRLHKCNVCQKTFSSADSLRTHFKSHNKLAYKKKREEYKCDFCDKVFTYQTNKRRHMVQFHVRV